VLFDNKGRGEREPNDPYVSNCSKTRAICPELKYLSCSNTEILRALFDEDLVNAVEWKELYSRPEPKVAGVDKVVDKVIHMLLGVAIGDSLGYPVEHLSPEERLKKYGLITSYINRRALPSDDTQLTFDTVKVILEHGRIVPWELARIFASHRISGMGRTVKEFLKNYRERGLPWYRTGVKRPSNGAIMRISPVIIPNLKTKENYLVDAVLDTLITHNEPLAIASSVAFADMLWNVINSNGRIDAKWIIERFVLVISKLTGDKKYKTRERARVRHEGPASEFIRDQVYYALDRGLSVQELSKTIGSGGYLLETVPNALFIFVRYLNDPQRGIIEAVNFTKDSDTIASIIASAFGALYGRQAFREEWMRQLPGKLLKHGQDGEVFQLLNCIEAFLTS
jgi:ADP-ribosyl-[dinitrogen reductase] hydrolase